MEEEETKDDAELNLDDAFLDDDDADLNDEGMESIETLEEYEDDDVSLADSTLDHDY